MCSRPCLVTTTFMELMQPRPFSVSSFGTRSSLSSNLPVAHNEKKKKPRSEMMPSVANKEEEEEERLLSCTLTGQKET